eukprot:CAMPEP_0182456948 /NCGR_PEP_ID=MMETSP1319-20130603/2649_1 /TAXON_ID=172717 /ORGANISM="Bolidomonas pacifica, Strain RCC208" /LENGTH=65 /DNA_ID=CAMNT_0024655309 /DNA_START=281 /DNA_END=474 /DNA_ORIENTATION=-
MNDHHSMALLTGKKTPECLIESQLHHQQGLPLKLLCAIPDILDGTYDPNSADLVNIDNNNPCDRT